MIQYKCLGGNLSVQVAAYGGGTGVSVPLPLRSMGLPPYVELGVIYKAGPLH